MSLETAVFDGGLLESWNAPTPLATAKFPRHQALRMVSEFVDDARRTHLAREQ